MGEPRYEGAYIVQLPEDEDPKPALEAKCAQGCTKYDNILKACEERIAAKVCSRLCHSAQCPARERRRRTAREWHAADAGGRGVG
jgi:hypothetical protein|tara:strand:- start:22 stop:276 length:255 start_codon:yes stop_codon:yes gene_type:complete